MNPLEVIPWKRAFLHAHSVYEEAPLKERIISVALVLLYTSLPVTALYAFAFSITLVTASSLTALFLLTVGDLNREQSARLYCAIQRLYYSLIKGVPGWLFDRGFRGVYNPPGDGSCFFKAVERGIGIPEKEVRSMISKWIQEEVKFGGTYWVVFSEQFKAQLAAEGKVERNPAEGDIVGYANRIERGDRKVWGDALEARAIAEQKKCFVQVHMEAFSKPQKYGDFDRGINLYYTSTHAGGKENHYKLLLR